jgi:hypothetical protein
MVEVEDTVGPDAPVSSFNPVDDMKQQDEAIKEVVAVKVQVKADPAAATNGDAPTQNGAPVVPIIKMEETIKPTTCDDDDDGDEDDDDDMKTPVDEEEDLEEKLFEKLEHDQQEQELTHSHEHHQPKDVKAAPKLLQSAFQKGEVAAEDDSESDSEKKSAAVEAVASSDHTHARVSKKQGNNNHSQEDSFLLDRHVAHTIDVVSAIIAFIYSF